MCNCFEEFRVSTSNLTFFGKLFYHRHPLSLIIIPYDVVLIPNFIIKI